MCTITNQVLPVTTKYVKETPTLNLKYPKSEASSTKFSAVPLRKEPDLTY